MRIAVIGSGISGLGAAHALAPHHDVTVYERDGRPGGHSNTIDINYDGTTMSVDTGFIVYNELNYPHLTALFKTLGVTTEASNMSFAVSRDHGRFEWGGDRFATLFAQKRNLFNPTFLTMVRDILRFNAKATSDLAANKLGDERLGDYLTKQGFSKSFMTDYLLPMAAAIWSTPAAEVMDFPAHSFISFFDNHRLLSGFEGRPVWRTVSGGSRQYVQKITAPLGDHLRLNCGAVDIRRHTQGIAVKDTTGQSADYDIAILATHADITAKIVADLDDDEPPISPMCIAMKT
jgi:predicted NAD/FAD-binding protein